MPWPKSAGMAQRRLSLSGLFAALMVLMVQLAAGAGVPDGRPGLQVFGTICHAAGDTPETPSPPRPECLICPLCAALHAPPLTILPLAAAVPRPRMSIEHDVARPDRAAAPRSDPYPQGQPRAPPGVA